MDNRLPRCAPEEIGLSSRRVEAFLQAICHDQTTMNGFMAARCGKVFAECWWAPYRADLVHANHSFGKSYTATAIGIALKEGYLTLDEKMTDIFAQEIEERHLVIPDQMRRITVENVLTMTNGMARHPDMNGDWIGNYFSTPMAYEPGTHFSYNSTGSCMLGAIILKRTGSNLKDYLTERLFKKIGIDPDRFVWRRFPNGIDGEPGTFATTEDNLRLAMLYLNGGCWNGEQILDRSFVDAALSVQINNEYAPEQKDGRCGYGYQLWACSIPGLYRFDGGQGQYGLIWPEKQIAVSLHEGAMSPYGPQKTLDTIYEQLFAYLQDEPLPPAGEDYAHLLQTERGAALPGDAANLQPVNQAVSGSYIITDGLFDPWFAVAPPGAGDLFLAFRTPEKDIPITEFELRFTGDDCVLDMGAGREVRASWDGSLTAGFTDSPYDLLGEYAASARFVSENCLEINIHWLCGWFETLLSFEKTGTQLQITTKKLRLNEADNHLVYTASAALR